MGHETRKKIVFTLQNGVCMGTKEIARAIGAPCASKINGDIQFLRRKGMIERTDGKASGFTASYRLVSGFVALPVPSKGGRPSSYGIPLHHTCAHHAQGAPRKGLCYRCMNASLTPKLSPAQIRAEKSAMQRMEKIFPAIFGG